MFLFYLSGLNNLPTFPADVGKNEQNKCLPDFSVISLGTIWAWQMFFNCTYIITNISRVHNVLYFVKMYGFLWAFFLPPSTFLGERRLL